MRRGTRLLAAVCTLFTLGIAGALPSHAASTDTATQAGRTYVLVKSTTTGFSEVDMTLTQRLARATTGSSGRTVNGSLWEACVDGWTDDSLFNTCAAPKHLTVTMPTLALPGRISFDLRDPVWGDTAAVRLDLPALYLAPTPTYTLGRGSSGGSTAWFASAGLGQDSKAVGTIRITTIRGKRHSQRTHQIGGSDRIRTSNYVETAGIRSA